MDKRFYLIFNILFLTFIFGCSNYSQHNTYKVKKQDFEQYIAFVGSLEAESKKTISPPYYGKVLWLENEGRQVKKGDILIKLDTSEVKAEHEQNILGLKQEENNLELFRLNGEYNEFSYKRDVAMKKISYEQALSSYNSAVYGKDTEEIEHKILNIDIKKREIVRLGEILSGYEEYVELGYVSDDDKKRYEKDLIVKNAQINIMQNELEILKKGKSEDIKKEAELSLYEAENSYKESLKKLDVYNKKREIDIQMYNRDIQNAREKLEHTTELIEESVIKAPDDGIFVYADIWTDSGKEILKEGLYISKGESVGYVSSSEDLVINIFVNEFEAVNIKKDDKVLFALDCEIDKFYNAKVIDVENLAQYSEIDVLKVKKIKILAKVLSANSLFCSGMTVSGRIITKNIKNIIAIPTNAINNDKVTMENGKIKKVNVGLSNYFLTIIESGIKENDIIKLNYSASIVDFEKRKLQSPKFRNIRNFIEDTGVFESKSRQIIKSPGRGKIQTMKEEGDNVKKHDIIASIDKTEIQKEFEKLELDISLKESNKELTLSQKEKELFSLEQDILKRQKDIDIAIIEYYEVYNPTSAEKLKRLERNFAIAELRLDSLKKELKIKKELSDKGYIAKEKIDELQTSYDQNTVDLKFKKIELDRHRKHADLFQISKRKRRKILAELELEISKMKFENKKKEYSIKLELVDEEIEFMKNKLDLINNIMNSLSIKSQIDGVVVYVKVWKGGKQSKVQVGDETYTGSSICQISQVDNLIIMGKVSETEFLDLKKGQKVEFYLPGFESEKYSGVLSDIGSFALKSESSGESGSYFDVKIDIDNVIAKFQPGMSVNFAIISEEKKNILTVSRDSVFHDKNGDFVYMQDKSKRYIKTGIEDNEFVEIISGINDKDKIYSEVITLGKN
ncbi:MAG: HlyD family efflux transporter periplasmic adaptor subunit [Candidatus Muirbacterium halophilum]|nr:HlyD family efflux transporter periplasmic adaptor subunit [Candidatus Muirbacterium halophilum]MCK9474978.1 HlyD family efflux transporter periplasmic adaptor subunit [Candidatus Muirbacterium halophilum]